MSLVTCSSLEHGGIHAAFYNADQLLKTEIKKKTSYLVINCLTGSHVSKSPFYRMCCLPLWYNRQQAQAKIKVCIYVDLFIPYIVFSVSKM